ncbi:MAG TPA: sigma-54 dependent transcriptional regulator [Bacteroidota bacterium]|nr:sigma-54 dependent transcriptional regulator [Bacteroidota bacterium]
MEKLLIIDDNTSFMNDVESLLDDRYQVLKADTGSCGIDILKSEQISAVLLDLELPDMFGTEVLRIIHEDIEQHMPVIIVTDHSDIENAVEAMRRGAYDFLPKNFNRELLTEKIHKALERRSLELRVNALQNSIQDQQNKFICISDKMKKVNYEMTRMAALNFDILLNGETGAGKDTVAYELHSRSLRHDKPFIPISVKSLSETLIESELFGHEKGAFSGADKSKIGKFEAAHGGTVYIPEISCLTESVQLKLLHFLQYKSLTRVGQDPRKPEVKVDVRVIMATNENLQKVVAAGRLREDFYFRIAGVSLTIPPLRERMEDIEPIARYVLRKNTPQFASAQYVFAPDVITLLRNYSWPGNVRELENAVKNALAYADGFVLTPEHFPNLTVRRMTPLPEQTLQTGLEYKEAERLFREEYCKKAMRQAGGSIPQAAKLAGMTPQGFRKILAKLDL